MTNSAIEDPAKWMVILMSIFFLLNCQPSGGPHQPILQGKGASTSGQNVSFAEVLPIFTARCYRCHNSGTNDWTKENNLRRVALSGVLVRRLSTNTMPQQGSPEAQAITSADREKLIAWADGEAGLAAPGTSDPLVVKDRNLSVIVRCSVCHGLNGTAVISGIPNLASHDPGYITGRLSEFLLPSQSGTMPGVIKQIFADYKLGFQIKNGTDVEFGQEAQNLVNFLARYFSNQYVNPPAEEFQKRHDALSDDDKKLFDAGKKLVSEQCVACHLRPDYRPRESIPMIFGQPAEYIRGRLAQFKKGEGGQVMPTIVAGLSEDDLKAVVPYLSNSHPTQAQPSQ